MRFTMGICALLFLTVFRQISYAEGSCGDKRGALSLEYTKYGVNLIPGYSDYPHA
jgi:hypothetical protein